MPATLCNFSVALTLFVTARDSSDAITLVSEKVWGEMSKPNADGTSINAMSEDITVEHLDGIVPPALRTLDGQPLDRASLTLGQVVEVQGVWDDDGFCEVVAADDVSSSEYFAVGETLAEFLLQELVEGPIADSYGVEDLAAWTEARRRADRTLAEMQAVRDALHRYGPQS